MSTRQEVYKLIIEKKDNKEIAAALNISVRTVERYRKDFNDTTNDNNDDKNATATNDNRRKKKEKAKALIESGETIRDVGDKLGLSKSVVGRLSSKEKLQVKQLDYLKSFREQYREEITKNKKDRLNLNNLAKEKIEYTLNLAEDISKDTQKLIKMNEETEQKIFELDRIERLERLELEKNKFKNDLLIDFTERIQKLTDENIMKVLDFMKSLESDTDESAN
ncbi:helix-turn-helix domain-containing protein [Fusobacterium animalis]|uniref:LuxR C-terminal-related transcriptional regulator n=1 Tax=Fusobacterium animalis TaxID=76859 RepID=UPI0032487A0A